MSEFQAWLTAAPWAMGAWVDHLGDRARTPAAYAGPFGAILSALNDAIALCW